MDFTYAGIEKAYNDCARGNEAPSLAIIGMTSDRKLCDRRKARRLKRRGWECWLIVNRGKSVWISSQEAARWQ